MNWQAAQLVDSASNNLRNALLEGDGVTEADIEDAMIRIQNAMNQLLEAKDVLSRGK